MTHKDKQFWRDLTDAICDVLYVDLTIDERLALTHVLLIARNRLREQNG